jgi:ATP-dependent RNA helicase RhlE
MRNNSQSGGYGRRSSFRSRPGNSRGATRGGWNNSRSGGGATSSFRGFDKMKQATFNPTRLIAELAKQTDPDKQASSVQEEFHPAHSFSDFAFDSRLERNIAHRGYTQPTPIQDQTIEHLMAGRDVVGIAKTGSGKTAAFLLPLIHKTLKNPQAKTLIVVPTRELAVQVQNELHEFSRGLPIFSTLCIGGVSLSGQVSGLRRRPQFVVGTPGRLRDLEERRALSFHSFNAIVLDEVDRMLDMGFIHEVRYMIDNLAENRHSLFFSATMTEAVKNIMRGFLNNPVMISIASNTTAPNIHQDIVRLQGKPKIEVLHDLLRSDGFEKVLVFGRTKRGVEKLSRELEVRGFRVAAIHGNKTQNQRQRALDSFERNRVKVLLATDVVARGLDISDVTHVINYELPESYEDYIHRIGRTGRADKSGVALTIVE